MDWKEGEEPLRKAIEQRKKLPTIGNVRWAKGRVTIYGSGNSLLLYQLGSLSSCLLLASIIGVPVMHIYIRSEV